MTKDMVTHGLFTLARSATKMRAPHSRGKEANMRAFFCNPEGQLRNGVWIVIFLVLFVASRFVYHPVSQAIQHLNFDAAWLQPLPFIFALLVTWACVRLRRQRLSSVGFEMDRRWAKEVGVGVGIGTAAMLAIAALIVATGGAQLSLDPARSLAALGSAAWVFACVALFEETLFRGFVFQRMVDGAGIWIAQISLALLFAIAHWDNPGMEPTTQVLAMIDTALGAILLGLAYLRTRSLALPIGIHFGWNWAQGALLGFDVSGFAQAGWLHAEILDKPQWVTGGKFGPEASMFAVIVDLITVALLWRWRGTRARS
ncbi:CPBP family intramembrane metalloprotease [Pseudolysobacter antarcticus]|uniref:CPBP family intramembrane metalloprotease n=2 Tax=Pseudolysobacter antarcticus TaxID=2511995 RepID=A0A411HKD4_9GAMM|nr:CPBP family intramembrane metalloprotease [Pseudolysobacter antarcticus]